ncbi:STAS domain-containing protein [Sphaerisporangium flaviroseum]|uniref:Anti-sigma factor antagonist n=1 Tax=Sphaerisporangium flaviroseum TaxID=509199 RepID=A0ABP7IFL3_9ACTN
MTAVVQLAAHPDDSLPEVAIVSFTGELDYTNAEQLRQDVLGVLTPEHRHLIVDLSELPFCDSTGLRILLALRSLIDDRGGTVALSGLQPRLNRIFKVTGLFQFFAVQPTVADAVELLRPQLPA